MNTTRIAIAMLLATGCSDDADIGTNTTPVTCTNQAFANVSGGVTDPNNGQHPFDTASPIATMSANGTSLILDNGAMRLRFAFYCGAPQIASYGVKGDTQGGLVCPLEVASLLLGIVPMPAQSGTLIIDQNANCLAGRFAVDFGDKGSIDGSFSAPWQ